MEKVIISRYLELRLTELVEILYEEEYFGFIEDAENYVDRIYDFIEKIPKKALRRCFNSKYGEYFARYDNPKSSMQYFITYNKSDNRYYIENIISPKTKEYLEIIE